MGAKKPALLDVALGVAFGKATFEWGVVAVSPGFNKMEATTIREVTGDVRHDPPVPDGLARGGCGPAEGCITKDMDSLNRFGSLVTLLSSVPLLDSLKFDLVLVKVPSSQPQIATWGAWIVLTLNTTPASARSERKDTSKKAETSTVWPT